MGPGHYLHPHIDNSHDMERQRYRILNLLYYTTPDWTLENGGNLELWPNGTKAQPHTIHSKFNRLVVIATNRTSWHSVSEVRADRNRTCVFAYSPWLGVAASAALVLVAAVMMWKLVEKPFLRRTSHYVVAEGERLPL